MMFRIFCKNCDTFRSYLTSPGSIRRTLTSRVKKSALIKYKVFREADADIIYDNTEVPSESRSQTENTESLLGPLKRGVTGVFDVEELVSLLKDERLHDICVVHVPKELHYVDYLVIATAHSVRHRTALGEYIRKCFKVKRNETDRIPSIEGGQTTWMAMDLGNIALHVFDEATRETYDLETLWAVGPEFDEATQILSDEHQSLFEEYSFELDEFLKRQKLLSKNTEKTITDTSKLGQ